MQACKAEKTDLVHNAALRNVVDPIHGVGECDLDLATRDGGRSRREASSDHAEDEPSDDKHVVVFVFG